MSADIKQLILALTADRKWSEEQVRLGVRADFRCEYCDRDLLTGVDEYDSWQVDHIVPKSRGGLNTADNQAIACRTCNASMKRRWDPRTVAGVTADRTALLSAVRDYVRERRMIKLQEVERVRDIVRRV